MRPDKKKNRHHDSVKCENKAKAKLADKAKKEGKKQCPDNSKGPANDGGVNTDLPHAPPEQGEFQRRQVTSNWTKYEIPSSSEDEADVAATGPEFNFVLENASKASDHLQLKSEKEWDNKHLEFNNDFFALNLANLESKMDCIALHEMLGIPNEEIDVIYPLAV